MNGRQDIRTWEDYNRRAAEVLFEFDKLDPPRGLPGWMVHNYNLLEQMAEDVHSLGPRNSRLDDARSALVLFAERVENWQTDLRTRVPRRGGYESN